MESLNSCCLLQRVVCDCVDDAFHIPKHKFDDFRRNKITYNISRGLTSSNLSLPPVEELALQINELLIQYIGTSESYWCCSSPHGARLQPDSGMYFDELCVRVTRLSTFHVLLRFRTTNARDHLPPLMKYLHETLLTRVPVVVVAQVSSHYRRRATKSDPYYLLGRSVCVAREEGLRCHREAAAESTAQTVHRELCCGVPSSLGPPFRITRDDGRCAPMPLYFALRDPSAVELSEDSRSVSHVYSGPDVFREVSWGSGDMISLCARAASVFCVERLRGPYHLFVSTRDISAMIQAALPLAPLDHLGAEPRPAFKLPVSLHAFCRCPTSRAALVGWHHRIAPAVRLHVDGVDVEDVGVSAEGCTMPSGGTPRTALQIPGFLHSVTAESDTAQAFCRELSAVATEPAYGTSALPVVVLISGGRHGLGPIAYAIGQDCNVRCVMYIGCNNASARVDCTSFLQCGLAAVHVWKAPLQAERCGGEQPEMCTALLFVRRQPPLWLQPLLVLPVGPAGTGKTTLATALQSFVCDKCNCTTLLKGADGPLFASLIESSRSCLLPAAPEGSVSLASDADRNKLRCLDASVQYSGGVAVFHRDSGFSACRSAGLSLKTTRTALHGALLQFLANSCWGSREFASTALTLMKVLDSTNGSEQARELYWREATNGKCGGSFGACVWFRIPSDVAGVYPADPGVLDVLSSRTVKRQREQGQIFGQLDSLDVFFEHSAKHKRILSGIEAPAGISLTACCCYDFLHSLPPVQCFCCTDRKEFAISFNAAADLWFVECVNRPVSVSDHPLILSVDAVDNPLILSVDAVAPEATPVSDEHKAIRDALAIVRHLIAPVTLGSR